MSEMTPAKATALRKPFPPESVGQLPKGGQLLDFVGHAAVTDRLLTVDPEWSWDFAELDPATGKPSLRFSLDPDGNLWIKMTVCGVTRIGVGDGKNAKERISDAIRNAAMRFGVALDLWAKENLVEFAQAAVTASRQPEHTPPTQPVAPPAEPEDRTGTQFISPMSDRTRGRMYALFTELKITDADEQRAGIATIVGRPVESRASLTEAEGKAVIKRLEEKKRNTSRQESNA